MWDSDGGGRVVMIVDAHCHMFTPRLVHNVSKKTDMAAILKLGTEHAYARLSPAKLDAAASLYGVDTCILLPTAHVHRVKEENDRHVSFTRESSRIRTLATLHPHMSNIEEEVERVFSLGIPGFKFSSFTQGFDLASPECTTMMAVVERVGLDKNQRPVMVFDTFVGAHEHFAADPAFLTTPKKLAEIVERHSGITIIGAHMGGLTADCDEIVKHLKPRDNLYLDTSNAAHTLQEDEFVQLLHIHGPEHILFGTDWPWFHYRDEIALIRSLALQAGFSELEINLLFGGNAQRIFSL
ncbi:MAG: Amidohydro-rel protein [Thermodesulfobacteriota bacterium]|nr:Amidohydro-rel protein [Thermodesulfobacteriota bacterium]